MRIDWPFLGGGDDELRGNEPTVDFENVRLNVGEFLNGFADSVLGTAHDLTEPFDAMLAFLQEPLPILGEFGIEVTPLELADALSGVLGFEFDASFIESVADLSALLDSLPENVSDQLFLPLGGFRLNDATNMDLRDADSFADPTMVDPPNDPSFDPVMALRNGGSQNAMVAVDFLEDAMETESDLFSFPIIEDPGIVFQILLGQDADLFLFDMPDLNVTFEPPAIQAGPLIPPIPLFVTLGGRIEAKTDLSFGFDTHGLQVLNETGNSLDSFSGFFIDDNVDEQTGDDAPEATLLGILFAGAELDLAIASAGVEGGLRANQPGRVRQYSASKRFARAVDSTGRTELLPRPGARPNVFDYMGFV